MVPFVIAGLGASHANMNEDDDIILEYGLGLKYFLSDNVALRGEAKHVFDCDSDDNNNQSCYNNFTYTFGFTIQNNKW
jgi:OOP family OmpA-OmpF porin